MITIKALNTLTGLTAFDILSSLAYGGVKGQTVYHESVLLTGTLFPVVTIPTHYMHVVIEVQILSEEGYRAVK